MTDDAPLLTRKVIGYRQWAPIAPHDPGLALYPLAWPQGGPWTSGANTARCLAFPGRLDHDAPAAGCRCGFNVLHDVPPKEHPMTIVGAVAAWGRIEVHEHGFRAQYAEPVALANPEWLGAAVASAAAYLATKYGIPLVPLGQLEAEARKHGSPIPEHLRPAKANLTTLDHVCALGICVAVMAAETAIAEFAGLRSTWLAVATAAIAVRAAVLVYDKRAPR